MDAFSLYKTLGLYDGAVITTICKLHKSTDKFSCIDDPNILCKKPSRTNILDFDRIKDSFCANNAIGSPLASVDGITFKNDKLLFVEIKSNKNFLKYQLRAENTEQEADDKIKGQIEKYHLKKKIDDSRSICECIVNDYHLFDNLHSIYVLVTDTDNINNPLQQFQAHLNTLAYNSINLMKLNKALEVEMDSIGKTNRLVYCKDFDAFVTSL